MTWYCHNLCNVARQNCTTQNTRQSYRMGETYTVEQQIYTFLLPSACECSDLCATDFWSPHILCPHQCIVKDGDIKVCLIGCLYLLISKGTEA